MKRIRKGVIAALSVVSLLGVVGTTVGPAGASSHREAPLISQDATADNTDLYAFRDPVDPTMLNIIANYVGLEIPQGGPNWQKFGDDVLYQIHINNTDKVEDNIVYSFRFKTIVDNPDTFLYNTNRITQPNAAPQNVRQVYTVEKRVGNKSTVVATDLPTPPVNIGPRSTPDYEAALAQPTVSSLPGGGKVFAGQRADVFFADLGSVFDLLGLRPLNSAHAITPPTTSDGVDGLAGLNVHTIALQVPITEVSRNGDIPTVVDSKDSFVGIYASASRFSTRVLSGNSGNANAKGNIRPPMQNGKWVQVSRLGIPLVNEVLIPLGKKDLWNASSPANDAQFFANILDPEPAKLIPALYPGVTTPKGGTNPDGSFRRSDIVAVLTGQAAGLSAANALPPADLLRVNLAVAPNGPGDRLAVLAGDTGGFPNGRRLTDDVVDIELRLLAGGTPFTPTFNVFPNNALTDGVDTPQTEILPYFPYISTPLDGYSHQVPGPPAP
jgi:hypothetical protein